jgi:hypothetical protein
VLRQWLLEETIKKLEHGSGLARRKLLGDIMHVSSDDAYRDIVGLELISFP